MLDELLEVFERDRQTRQGQRRSTRNFFDRFSDDDDERARRSHSGSNRYAEYPYEYEQDGWDDDSSNHR